MSNWIKDRKKDEYYKKAKRGNFRSRATYKLTQLNKKYKFLNNAKIVIDVCCAPGGWIQAIQSAIGKNVFILGIDINRIKSIEGNVKLLQADLKDSDINSKIGEILTNKADVVVADCSMNTSGTSNLDIERQNYLVNCIIENITIPFLKKGGHFITKVFQGSNTKNIKNNLKKNFKFIKYVKPKASLSRSREIYLVCKYFI